MPEDMREKVQLLGTSQTIFSKSLQFKILKCNNATLGVGETCANADEINNYADRVAYELWVKEEKENFQASSDHYRRQVLQQDNRMTTALLSAGKKISYTRVYIRPNFQEIEGQLF